MGLSRLGATLREVPSRAWFSYGTLLLQLKVLWGIGRYRDLSFGDTSGDFVIATSWQEKGTNDIAWSPLYTAFYGIMLEACRDAYAATTLHRVAIVVMLMQRPRASYLYGLYFLLTAAIGLCASAIFERTVGLNRVAMATPVVAVALLLPLAEKVKHDGVTLFYAREETLADPAAAAFFANPAAAGWRTVSIADHDHERGRRLERLPQQ